MLNQHVEMAGVIPEEQKAMKKGQQGCLNALLVYSGEMYIETISYNIAE